MSQAEDIVIVSAARTAIGRFQGMLRDVPAPDLGATVIREAVARAGVPPSAIDEVLLGNVLQAGVGQAPARQASLRAGLPDCVGATTINKVCGSGIKAMMLGAAMLRAGDARVIVAGGMESMNGAPYLLPKARFGYRLGPGQVLDAAVHDGLWCAIEQEHMGLTAEKTARAYGLTRQELDAHALLSHQRAVAALERGAFAREIVPVSVPQSKGPAISFIRDECPRQDTSLEKLAQLPPAFSPEGCVTAGNASAIADGAAALVMMRRETAKEYGCIPLARVVHYAQVALAPAEIFAAPIHAIRKVLQGAHLALEGVDLLELNEAFAAQTLADGRALGLDWERVNVNGGAIALGHPIGASGARIMVTLLYALSERKLTRGLAAACLGGGEAVSMIVEME